MTNKKVTEIIHDILTKKHVGPFIKILDIYDTIIQQNYFHFYRKCHTQEDGLPMEEPASSILSEFYIQCMEHALFVQIL